MRVLMCAPRHYAIRYEINPWMKIAHPIRARLAREQWEALYRALRRLGVSVLQAPQERRSPDMVFTANAGLVRGRVFIPSHFRYPQRGREEAAFLRFFKKRRYRVVDAAEGLYFEGEGDLLGYRDLLFGGFRFRSELSAHEKVGAFLGQRVVGLELAHPRFYHLDTCFFPLDERSALYYPGAFDAYGRRVIQRFVQNPVPVQKIDAYRFACNAVRVGRTVVSNAISRTLKAQLGKLGYRSLEVPMSEFVKAGGSVKCLLLILSSGS